MFPVFVTFAYMPSGVGILTNRVYFMCVFCVCVTIRRCISIINYRHVDVTLGVCTFNVALKLYYDLDWFILKIVHSKHLLGCYGDPANVRYLV